MHTEDTSICVSLINELKVKETTNNLCECYAKG